MDDDRSCLQCGEPMEHRRSGAVFAASDADVGITGAGNQVTLLTRQHGHSQTGPTNASANSSRPRA